MIPLKQEVQDSYVEVAGQFSKMIGSVIFPQLGLGCFFSIKNTSFSWPQGDSLFLIFWRTIIHVLCYESCESASMCVVLVASSRKDRDVGRDQGSADWKIWRRWGTRWPLWLYAAEDILTRLYCLAHVGITVIIILCTFYCIFATIHSTVSTSLSACRLPSWGAILSTLIMSARELPLEDKFLRASVNLLPQIKWRNMKIWKSSSSKMCQSSSNVH